MDFAKIFELLCLANLASAITLEPGPRIDLNDYALASQESLNARAFEALGLAHLSNMSVTVPLVNSSTLFATQNSSLVFLFHDSVGSGTEIVDLESSIDSILPLKIPEGFHIREQMMLLPMHDVAVSRSGLPLASDMARQRGMSIIQLPLLDTMVVGDVPIMLLTFGRGPGLPADQVFFDSIAHEWTESSLDPTVLAQAIFCQTYSHSYLHNYCIQLVDETVHLGQLKQCQSCQMPNANWFPIRPVLSPNMLENPVIKALIAIQEQQQEIERIKSSYSLDYNFKKFHHLVRRYFKPPGNCRLTWHLLFRTAIFGPQDCPDHLRTTN